jgi:hypothetical protein
MVEDLSAFFVDHAASATWEAATIRGIFDRTYAEAFGIIGGNSPRFICAASDVAGAATGDEITIAETVYTIAEIQPDGTGLVQLILEAV